MIRRLLVIVAVLALASCGGSPDGRGEVRIELRRRFRDGAESERPVDLDLLIAGDWERLVVVCPGDAEDEVQDALGFAWDDFPGTVQDEDEALLVFPGDGEVVTWARFPRANGDPCRMDDRSFDRDDAVFTVTADGDRLVLSPAA